MCSAVNLQSSLQSTDLKVFFSDSQECFVEESKKYLPKRKGVFVYFLLDGELLIVFSKAFYLREAEEEEDADVEPLKDDINRASSHFGQENI